MKKLRSSIILLFVLGFVTLFSVSTSAQSSRKLSSTPKAFQTFYAKFKAAVAQKDKKAVAALTKFPFRYGWDAGDEGTYTRGQFLAKYNDIFGGTAKFFAQKNPTFYSENGSFSLTNEEDASHYLFEKRGSTYVFSAIMVEP